ncbi:MAG: GNAT family N-acetyltransferase [Anaerolineae bacterium]|nr:GNAT family N-acetyltransferase [Anaerolineae bacterium]MCB9132394.1 GNAT family N-acetyltransferase [Anaerolineales bacterium]MCB0227773.1 GNAT family N-acetyltransferase [Anaerolineae bacterium]MCB0233198.1 GNAT family N-acetyltransferase [Anaerolineae bacterium]MCB0237807.1 GNAT family N-acetyltransferase [Anaerolineae bacterium]
MIQSTTLRPASDNDLEFLYRVYASTRTEELAVVPWSAAEKDAFLRMQFEAQHRYYHQQFVAASFDIVLRHGEPAGRLYVEERPDEIRIIDIALLPRYRGRGIGSALLQDILERGAALALPVRIHVEKNNPALSLYHRLCFRQVEDQGVYYLMEWTPASPQPGNEGTNGHP